MSVLVPKERPRTWTLDDIVVTDPPIIRKAIGAAAIGNITEWYDFGVYAYLEPTIRDIFFSGLSETLGTIATFGTFAVAFLVRPFGGMFFGPLADRIGRNKVLAITMIMMALGTFAIGCLPSEKSVGFLAPALLLLCRLVQGFSTGGEYGNAMTFIAEYAPDRRRGFLGSFLEFGTFSGYLGGAIVATIVQDVVGDPALHDWAWRLPFFVALPLGVAGVYLRSRLADTPAYAALEKEAEEKDKANKARNKGAGEAKVLAGLWPFVLVCMGLVIVWNVTNYMLTSYMPTYISTTLPKEDTVSTLTSSVLQIVVMAVALLTIPFVGLLSDRIGRKPIIVGGSISLIVLALPMILLIRAGSGVSIFFGLLIMGLSLITFSATMPSTLPSLFPTKVRGAGLSVAFNVAISLFAGTTSVVVGSLVGATGDLNWPAYYLIAAGVVGLVAVYFLQEPNGRHMWGSAPAAESEEAARELVAEQPPAGAGAPATAG